MDEVDRHTLLMPLGAFQDMFGMQDSVHEIVVNAAILDDVEGIQKTILERLPGITAGTEDVGNRCELLNFGILYPNLLAWPAILASVVSWSAQGFGASPVKLRMLADSGCDVMSSKNIVIVPHISLG